MSCFDSIAVFPHLLITQMKHFKISSITFRNSSSCVVPPRWTAFESHIIWLYFISTVLVILWMHLICKQTKGKKKSSNMYNKKSCNTQTNPDQAQTHYLPSALCTQFISLFKSEPRDQNENKLSANLSPVCILMKCLHQSTSLDQTDCVNLLI